MLMFFMLWMKITKLSGKVDPLHAQLYTYDCDTTCSQVQDRQQWQDSEPEDVVRI